MTYNQGFVSLDNVRIHAYHGVIEQERVVGGDFSVSVKARYPLNVAMQSDNINDTLNYAELLEIINKEMHKPSCLLEHVAGRIGKSIFLAMPKVDYIEIKITKINPPMGGLMDGASVELQLSR